jgi:hypothetical protein
MQGWQTSYLGLRDLPRELSEFDCRPSSASAAMSSK